MDSSLESTLIDAIMDRLSKYLDPIAADVGAFREHLFKVESKMNLINLQFQQLVEAVDKSEDTTKEVSDSVNFIRFNNEKGFSRIDKLINRLHDESEDSLNAKFDVINSGMDGFSRTFKSLSADMAKVNTNCSSLDAVTDSIRGMQTLVCTLSDEVSQYFVESILPQKTFVASSNLADSDVNTSAFPESLTACAASSPDVISQSPPPSSLTSNNYDLPFGDSVVSPAASPSILMKDSDNCSLRYSISLSDELADNGFITEPLASPQSTNYNHSTDSNVAVRKKRASNKRKKKAITPKNPQSRPANKQLKAPPVPTSAPLSKNVFISRLKGDLHDHDVLEYIFNSLEGISPINKDTLFCKKISKLGSSVGSFKVNVPFALFDVVVSPSFWPARTLVKEFVPRVADLPRAVPQPTDTTGHISSAPAIKAIGRKNSAPKN